MALPKAVGMFDVAVVGRGASGLASALLLTRLGKSVVVIGRSASLKTIETLPPATMHAFRRCHGDDRCYCAAAVENFGTLSLWGDELPRAVDYLSQAPGVGYQVNRADLDGCLLAASDAAGAVILNGSRVVAIHREGSVWKLSVSEPSGPQQLVRAKFLVIANGRSGSTFGLARRQSIDALVAISFRTSQRSSEPRTWIEAQPSGWWYSVPAPDDQRAAAFFTDAVLVPKRSMLASWCREKLDDSKLTAKRIHSLEAKSVRVSDASTCRMEDAAGDDWAAVGDALASFDPISSSGLRFAFESALELSRLLGNAWHPGDYRAWSAPLWRSYAKGMRAVYQREGRWTNHRFWATRAFAADQLGRN